AEIDVSTSDGKVLAADVRVCTSNIRSNHKTASRKPEPAAANAFMGASLCNGIGRRMAADVSCTALNCSFTRRLYQPARAASAEFQAAGFWLSWSSVQARILPAA